MLHQSIDDISFFMGGGRPKTDQNLLGGGGNQKVISDKVAVWPSDQKHRVKLSSNFVGLLSKLKVSLFMDSPFNQNRSEQAI